MRRTWLWVVCVGMVLAGTGVKAEDVITEPIRTFGLGTLESAAYSPDGRHMATCGSAGAFLWDIESGSVIRTFSGHTDWVLSVAFSPDGTKVLTGSEDKTAKLWETATGVCLRTFSGHAGYVNSVAFSPDGTLVLTGAGYQDYTAKLWETATGNCIRTFTGHTDWAFSVAFSPDGTMLLTGSFDNTAKLWQAPVLTLRKITGTVWDDLNGNATRDTGEPGLQPWVVYLDQNLNGKIDPGESIQTTDSNGCYAFTDLGPGSYIVAHVVPPGWMQTYPATPAHIVALTAEQDAEGIDFGCQPKQQADVNGDGCVNVADLLIVRNRMGQGSCK